MLSNDFTYVIWNIVWADWFLLKRIFIRLGKIMVLDWFANIDPPHFWNFRNGTSSQAPLDGKELKIDCYEEEPRPHCSREYWSVFFKLPISRSAWRKGDTKGHCFALPLWILNRKRNKEAKTLTSQPLLNIYCSTKSEFTRNFSNN